MLNGGLPGIHLGAVPPAGVQGGTAARAGARAASLSEDVGAACAAAVSGGIDVSCASSGGGDSVTVTATVHIPKIVWELGNATKSATMPVDH
ncbi:pilus assembly protein [Streptomyces sp. NPDC054813]